MAHGNGVKNPAAAVDGAAGRLAEVALRACAVECPGLFARGYRRMSVGVITIVALLVFETLAVATVMPVVASALDGMSMYALAFASTLAAGVVGMVVGASWSDRHGPGIPLKRGLLGFIAGLLVAGTALDMRVFLLGRVMQGFGGGMATVALYVLVARVYPAAMRAKVFSAFAAAYVIPAMVGPQISGAIAQYVGWRWVFLCVPVLLTGCAWLVYPGLRSLGPSDGMGAETSTGSRVSWALGAACAAMLLNISSHQPLERALSMLAVAVVVLIVCVRRLLPSGTLRMARGLPSVIALRGLASSAFFGTEVYLPLLLVRERGLSPAIAGSILTFGVVGWSLGAWCRERTSRAEPLLLLRMGTGLLAAGVALVALLVVPMVPIAIALTGWFLAGVGMGIVYPTLSVLVLDMSPSQRQGLHSSQLQLSGSLFTAVTLAMGGAIFNTMATGWPAAAYLGEFALTMLLALIGLFVAGRAQSVRHEGGAEK